MSIREKLEQIFALCREISEMDDAELKEAHADFTSFQFELEDFSNILSYYSKAKYLNVGTKVSVLYSRCVDLLQKPITYSNHVVQCTIVDEPEFDHYAGGWFITVKVDETQEEFDCGPEWIMNFGK